MATAGPLRTQQPETPTMKGKKKKMDIESVHTEHLSYFALYSVYVGYVVLLFFAYFRDFIDRMLIKLKLIPNPFYAPKGYAPLFKELEYLWLRRFYQRIRDLFERPICSVAGARIVVMDRKSADENATFQLTGTTTECVNLGSYNYLGFAENHGPVIDDVSECIRRYSTATASPRMEAGNYEVIAELERTTARFVGQPAAMVFGMGFATNSTTIPALCTKGTLIISDSLNHASIVSGSRVSGSVIRVFKHNEPEDLEKLLRETIAFGQPNTRRPWKKIIIIVEGVYSMEGEICRLAEIVALKKKYKAYLYLDEAHSIGALGRKGRGVCEHTGVDPHDIDILMGTFTKAFGSVGGYISGTKELVDYLRATSYGSIYASAMSPPCAQQALSALKVIMGEDGTNEGQRRLDQLRDNSNFFRKGLKKLGLHVFGDKDSPVVPCMIYHPAKLPGLSRSLLARGIAVVIVGFPVTSLLLSRVRFCISAGHTRKDLEYALQQIDEVGDVILMKYGTKH
eukprot:TRINITY_DN1136_c0_g1_i1.p1 TRINITY_DN1136_c0_g1~~TRINITY_DN1136_c0_g1_i1.p1  ORF type:complete len:543 (-),score=106.47 TRINITY_DN1136_c0_g1_i1:77-1609(-)